MYYQDQAILMISIGNTRVKAMVWVREQNGHGVIVDSFAYAHDQLSQLSHKLSEIFTEIGQPKRIAIASVVPHLITPWHNLPRTKILQTADVPLQGLYASMGCDRAFAAFGAGVVYGYPVLVIDAGTAITLTSVNQDRQLEGGAILGGLRSQFATLHQNIPTLPDTPIPDVLPKLWANNTLEAIQSGIINIIFEGLQSYIHSWRSQSPQGKVILTGGDSHYFSKWGLSADNLDLNLIFWGMQQTLID